MREGLIGLVAGVTVGVLLAWVTPPTPPPPSSDPVPTRARRTPRPAAPATPSCEDEVSWLRGELVRLGETSLGWTEATDPDDRKLGYAVTGQGVAQRHEGVSLATVDCNESPCISFFVVQSAHWPHPAFLTDTRKHYGNPHARRFVELDDRVLVLIATSAELDEDTRARLEVRLDEAASKLREAAR